MDHVGNIFRPPSEAQSLLLQITVGCSYNKCTYCAMYDQAEQKFRIKDPAVIAADIAEAAAYAKSGTTIRRVFLCDGDALILPMGRLREILTLLREQIPSVRRVGIYGDARSILLKTPDELAELADLGLGIVYHGVESGDNKVLAAVKKGSTAEQAAAAAHRLKAAGIRHSVIIMLGLAGIAGSEDHAKKTATLLSQMDPTYVGALTTTLVPGTPLFAQAEAGEFTLPDPWRLLEELRIIIRDSKFTRCRFFSNHASNYLPLTLNLPADRQQALLDLDNVLASKNPDQLRPEHWRGL